MRLNDEPVSYRGIGTIGDQAPRNVSQLNELQRVRDLTQQCLAQALAAHRRVLRYANYYRARAEDLNKRAARVPSPEMRAKLLRLASLHEALAAKGLSAEGIDRPRVSSSDLLEDQNPLLDDEPPVNAAEYGEGTLQQRSAEDPIAQARRHIAEAQAHIARQEALVTRLSRDDRHVALAAEANEILDTLKHTLSLAQQHLEIELKK